MELVQLDKLGRILLPKRLRQDCGLSAGATLLAARVGDRLVLQPVDVQAWAKEVARELQDIDLDAIGRSAKVAGEREARRLYPGLARRKRDRGGDRAPAA